jgi:hypothetical protein
MARKSIETLLKEASDLLDAGEDEAALALYRRVLEIDFNNSAAHYDIGLIHKYRGEWRESFRFNKRAAELDPGNEAAQWNLGIAATALRDWKTARDVWRGRGMPIEAGDTPIERRFGSTPIRLNPDAAAEVVWASRICPVRAVIESIPFPESGVAYRDVVLHDGAPVGSRLDANGVEKSVFNMLEMFDPGPYGTYVVAALVDVAQVAALERLCTVRGLAFEDWTASVQVLCKACSEGRPHDQHDHAPEPTAWQRERRLAIAACDGRDVEAVLEEWDGAVSDWELALER